MVHDFTDVYPVLKRQVRIKRLSEFNLVVNARDEFTARASTEASVLLALCVGRYDVTTLAHIHAGVFRTAAAASKDYVGQALTEFAPCLEFLPTPSSLAGRYDPLSFLQPLSIGYRPPFFRQEKPSELVLALTFACNHVCDYCCNSSQARLADELQPAEWLRVIDEGGEFGVATVLFSGGEPLVYPGFLSLVERATNRGMYPTISTNGALLTDAVIEQLAGMGADHIHLSLPAASDDLYDRMTGRAGDLPKVVRAMRKLKQCGFYIRAKVVLTCFNIGTVGEILDLCRDCDVDFVHLARFQLTHRARGGVELSPSPAQFRTAHEIAEQRIARFGNRPVVGGPPVGDLQWRGPGDMVRCGGIKSKLTILPNGDVVLCEALGSEPGFVLGNVRAASLNEIWCSDLPEQLLAVAQESVVEPCRSCEHFSACRTGCFMCSRIVSSDPWSVDPRCWKAKIPGNPFRTREGEEIDCRSQERPKGTVPFLRTSPQKSGQSP